ncbi:FeoA family protein [Anaeromicropila populeti]|uniref:Ferrous iron transport protein A n=1 Tax=Anaeromicropila populeti TaxID=37658 RepID=A0A1I6JSU0_9FIRM|nr:FeoA domain-containing protein [Anaeromicropila populeti]SFR81988.1 ferrous iron transport protein A [Anaeromicropila populeti]
MKLIEGKIGFCYKVEDMALEKLIERRLGALGLTKGTKLYLLNKKGGSLIFKVRGTRLAVGKKIAEAIFVEEAAS